MWDTKTRNQRRNDMIEAYRLGKTYKEIANIYGIRLDTMIKNISHWRKKGYVPKTFDEERKERKLQTKEKKKENKAQTLSLSDAELINLFVQERVTISEIAIIESENSILVRNKIRKKLKQLGYTVMEEVEYPFNVIMAMNKCRYMEELYDIYSGPFMKSDKEKFLAYIDNLPDMKRDYIQKYYKEKKTLREIAKDYNVSISRSQAYLQSCLKNLLEQMESCKISR